MSAVSRGQKDTPAAELAEPRELAAPEDQAAAPEYHGVTCSHPHNLPYNDECAVWWLRGTPHWRLAHTNLPPRPEGSDQ